MVKASHALVVAAVLNALLIPITGFNAPPSSIMKKCQAVSFGSTCGISTRLNGIFGNNEEDERTISNLMERQSLSREDAEKEYKKFKVRLSLFLPTSNARVTQQSPLSHS